MTGDREAAVCPQRAAEASEFVFTASLSVFFPAFNDAPALPSLMERTFLTLRRVATDYEVIVVNDGSSDDTAAVLEDLRERYQPFLRVVTHSRNLGYGAALRSGLAAATKDYIFYTDGDGQYDPAEMEKLLRRAAPAVGLVNGYKTERADPWHRKAIGWLYNRFARWLFGIRLRDIDCDFRLMRRSALDLAALRATGGTICVELVRTLEMSGCGVVEVPVHHYARQHGRSQFFRVRSLAVTFLQLCTTFCRLVLMPALSRPAVLSRRRPPRAAAVWIGLALALLATLAYAPSLTLPFISDDYIQIQLARDYGPVSRWGALAGDALYRCRATSLVMTYWIDRAFGLEPFYYGVASLLLHVVNSLLVFALGRWRPVGWKVAALAAAFFAVSQRHSEAVVWFAAVPELLVFTFCLLAFLLWTRWLEPRSTAFAYWGAFACYVLALLSKESAVAVVPLCALASLAERQRPWRMVGSLAPFVATGAGYFLLDYAARSHHLHFNDGTFSLSAPFVATLLRSMAGLVWVWGALALPWLFLRKGRPWRGLVGWAVAWMAIALLPYSFLTYMPRVPSRHTYLASVGLGLIVGAGLVAFAGYARQWKRAWLVPLAAVLMVAHQCGYLWTVKQRQYAERARPTEQLIDVAGHSDGTVRATCFPYSPDVADAALELRFDKDERPEFRVGPEAAKHPDAVDFCNSVAYGRRY